jgi:hypothetical protein
MANYNADVLRVHGSTVANVLATIIDKQWGFAEDDDILVVKDTDSAAKIFAGNKLFSDLTDKTSIVYRAQAQGEGRIEYDSTNYLKMEVNSSGNSTFTPTGTKILLPVNKHLEVGDTKHRVYADNSALYIESYEGGAWAERLRIAPGSTFYIWLKDASSETFSVIRLSDNKDILAIDAANLKCQFDSDLAISKDATITAANLLHLYADNATDLLETADKQQINIEQDGAGDPGIGFELTSGQRFSIGIDNDDGDKFVIKDITNSKVCLKCDLSGNLEVPGSITSTGQIQAQQLNAEHTAGALLLQLSNSTVEDIDGGRETEIGFVGVAVGPTTHYLARLRAEHDGASADQRARVILEVNDGDDGTSPTEVLRIDYQGNVNLATGVLEVAGTQVVGAQGAALTAQLTSITHTSPGTPDYAIQDLTNSSAYGFVTKDEGNTVLSVLLNLQTRVAEIESRIEAHGLIAT